MTKQEFINKWSKEITNAFEKELNEVISKEKANSQLPHFTRDCTLYEQDNTTAMNCKHCGRSKWFHSKNLTCSPTNDTLT